jgi:pimeloyl-ACP methyl ester carboxylesterase
MILAHLTLFAASILGWSDITVQPSRSDRTHASFQRSLSSLEKPSERTLETLKRYDLERRYSRDVTGALASLEKAARANPDVELVYALAELSWVEGRRLERWRKAAAIDRFMDTLAYAHDFLFDPRLADGRQPSDPRYRLACDLYNGSLDRLIRAAGAKGPPIMPEGTIKLNVHGREQKLKVTLKSSPWTADDVDQIILASDFEVTGLETRSYQYGLGVPMIGIHRPENPGKGAERFYPPEMAFALTAFLKPRSRLNAPAGDGAVAEEGVLELYDPVTSHRVGTPPADLPVEADLTTPLAYMWSRTDLNRYRWSGLLRPGAALGRANLMLLRPYEPRKIPVVMIHGLISSPLAWIPMINELLRDPVIRDHYQFMLYMYPTGVPIQIAGAGLRETLYAAEQMYNPGGRDPAFGRMVLLGHSMGGLLAHEMAVDSENKYWQLSSDRPFDRILGEEKVLDELGQYMFFRPVPFVRRVVFLATPHRGSGLSRNMIGRVGSNLISEPDTIANLLYKLIKDNPEAFDRRQFRRMPTSIETLDPDSPILLALSSMRPNPETTFHSIMGAERPGPVAHSTDGVVPYRSSHIEGVKSELLVRSDHGVQKAPEAILEVQRILWEHIGLSRSQAGTGQPPVRRQAATAGLTERR